MVPTWAPGVIRTIREMTGYSYRQLGKRLGVADSSVMRWENGSVQMNEMNWGVVRHFYAEMTNLANVKPEEFMIVLPEAGLTVPSFDFQSDTVRRQDILNVVMLEMYSRLRLVYPGFVELIDIGNNNARNTETYLGFLGTDNKCWFEFCFLSVNLGVVLGDGLWSTERFVSIAKNIGSVFHGNHNKIASQIDLNLDLRGATVDFKVGCLMKDDQ